jgi:prepilin-type N-terminal cleavage/methylation domain-containing protein
VQQDRDIKGFSLLELLVVIAIIAGISAIAYPNFSSWTKDREIRKVSEKVANLLTSISTQAQRGSLPFVQLYVDPSGTGVKFITKGQSTEQYNSNLNEGKGTPNCSTATSGEFDKNEFDTFESTEIAVQFDTTYGAVCFSQNGTYYQTEGKLKSNLNVVVEGKSTKNYLIICPNVNAANKTVKKCALTVKDGLEKPAHLVKWSRFGNISKFKLFVKKNKDGVVIESGWTRQ